MNRRRLLARVLTNPRNVRFRDFESLVIGFGFQLVRTEGSHRIYSKPDVQELVNLQNVNGEVKPCQIRQFLRLVEQRGVELGEDE